MCEPALKLKSIFAEYRQEQYVYVINVSTKSASVDSRNGISPIFIYLTMFFLVHASVILVRPLIAFVRN